MIIKIDKEDLTTLVNTIFMGVYIANANRKDCKRLSEYDRVLDYIFSCYLKETKETHREDYGYDELCEEIVDDVDSLIKEYENSIMPITLSRLLAENYFPIKDNDDESFDRHYEMESLYEEELEKNGVKNLSLNVSDFE
ncbi:MAG: hypothetical protein ACI4MQ_08600 [Candidatus Coproplasma sp.]